MSAEWAERPDGELLERIREGRHDAFDVLVHRHSDRFYRLAFRVLGNAQAAEDIVQDAFLKLWEDPTRFRADRNVKFTTWFHRVVMNLCLDRRKKKTPQPLAERDEWPDEAESADVQLGRREEQRQLEREIDALPDRQRVALHLCFEENLSNQEAAERMGVKLKALQSLVMRAKTTLRQRLKAFA
jgi:RNA polymerase sigma-70 factor, ECF subfamily